MSIDRGSHVPPARQIADLIAADVRAGVYAPGQRLPSESTLVQQFGVAKQTARSALAILRREGVAYTLPGRGAFVVDPGARETVTLEPGSVVEARNATDRERRTGQDSPVFQVTGPDGAVTEHRADQVRLEVPGRRSRTSR